MFSRHHASTTSIGYIFIFGLASESATLTMAVATASVGMNSLPMVFSCVLCPRFKWRDEEAGGSCQYSQRVGNQVPSVHGKGS